MSLISTDKFKALEKISGSGDDTIIAQIVDQVESRFDHYTFRTLENATAEVTLDGNGKERFYDLDYPINSISSITLDGNALTENTHFYVKSSDKEAYLLKEGGVWTKDDRNIVMTYDRGYSTIPGS